MTQEQSRGALVAFSARATLHRGAGDPESLRSALHSDRADVRADAQASAQPDATDGAVGAVGAGDQEAGLLAAGRLLFAVTMA